jgi:hypothetical protein
MFNQEKSLKPLSFCEAFIRPERLIQKTDF